MNTIICIGQTLLLILLSPLVSGLIRKIKNNLRMRKGASVLQPYYNIAKLFAKGEVVSINASWIFKITPFLLISSSSLALLLVPTFVQSVSLNYIGDFLLIIFLLAIGRFFLALAGLDTGSAFGGMGSSREMFISSLVEPAAVMAIFAVSLNANSTNLHNIVNAAHINFSSIISAIALFFVIIAETSRIPVDNQETHLELTMVHEAMILEYSGRSLALIELSSHIKQIIFFSLIANIDIRRLNLHDEVWPEGYYPLRQDFIQEVNSDSKKEFHFNKVQGEGIFEVPVGPVHAGIIGPGHFRFSAAGEPVINLEIRLGFTHKGVEKLFEGKSIEDALVLSECISGDTAFSYSAAFCRAIEKISGIYPSQNILMQRAIFIELERMSNHAADMGGMALDVGFTFPANFAAIIKENLLVLNKKLTQSRYLKNINRIGGLRKGLSDEDKNILLSSLDSVEKDFKELEKILLSNISFMDRVDAAGILKKKTAEDLGIVGLAARASGIPLDLRKVFPDVYNIVKFKAAKEENGDVFARLKIRLFEFKESLRMIREFTEKIETSIL